MRRHALVVVLILTLVVSLHGRALAVDPMPDVKANGKDGPVTLGLNATLDVMVSLDPGDRLGESADWWLVAETPAGMYHYTLEGGWKPGLAVTRQAPMSTLDPMSVLTTSGLGLGSYTLYFGTDMLVNGQLDLDQAFYDEALVNIVTPVTFEKTYDGGSHDVGYSVQETSDGGFMVGGCMGGRHLMKTDSDGNEVWSQTYDVGCAHSAQETSDGGFIIAGGTSDGVYLVKTDADGNETWAETYGGDVGYSVQETSDGGFIVAGSKGSLETSSTDVYLLRTDSSGNKLWSSTFGGTEMNFGYSVGETSDGGFIITGVAYSFASGVGEGNAYLVKTDADGNEVWSKTLGGAAWDEGYSVQETSDGGFIIAGETSSFGAGVVDVYLVKTDADGNEVWTKTFGGKGYDSGQSVQETADGGFIIAGFTDSFGVGYFKVYLVKTDADGNELWSRTLGGNDASAFAYSVQEVSDGGFIVTGYIQTDRVRGDSDIYLVKTDALGNVYE